MIRWLDDGLGFNGSGHGLLLSGGSAANTHGIACARARALELGRAASDLTIYFSREAHLSLKQAAFALGFEPSRIRVLPVDAAFQLDLVALNKALEEDRDQGLIPTCVCGSLGTANTGAVDPLERIAKLASSYGAWFHVDGAYGAPAALTESYAFCRRGLERADSMSIDPHKWLFAPFDVGCVLVRDPSASRLAFARTSEYITVERLGEVESFAFFDHGPELSRRLRALKVWMILKVRGLDTLAQEIQRNIDLRLLLDRRIREEDRLELLGSELSISCFRFRPNPSVSEDDLNAINREILETLLSEGHFLMSPTTLEGRYSLRVCIVNFRTQASDIEELVQEVLRLGTQLTENR